MRTSSNIEIRQDAEQTVLDLINFINEEDFTTARELVWDNFTFDGVMGKRDGAEAYFADLAKMKMHYSVIRSFAKGLDVCVLSNLNMGDKKEIFCCSWYKFRQGKIASLKVVFDPR
ncbi:nuclear transport factor 2 family protein, partial [Puia sp.]|uniref:nuclear transport factor 2 family protein n=1 Tax=Puia sp. TaxID=2045100 RepID=UPI002F3EC667